MSLTIEEAITLSNKQSPIRLIVASYFLYLSSGVNLSALRSLIRYFEVSTGGDLMPGVIAAIQTFGDRINFHPHLHFLVTEGGADNRGDGPAGLPGVHRPGHRT